MQAEVVIAFQWFWPITYPVYLAHKLRSFPLLGIPLFHPTEDWSYQPFLKRMIRACDAIITNTEYEAEFARNQGCVRAEVGGVGIEPAAFERRDGRRIRSEFGLEDDPVVGFVGRRALNKGLGTLLRAMKIIWRQNPRVHLVLAGGKHPLQPELQDLLNSFTQPERDRLVWIDNFDESAKSSIFDAFDVFVLPSTSESFGIAYLEAWMCKKPVIGARIGTTACVIEDGIDGMLVDPDDPQDTAQAVISLLSDQERREKMGCMGRLKTLANYTWDKVSERVEGVCLEVGMRGKSRSR
jgi:glycosyltransferase involved in cell wall biosynthesis